MSDIDIDRLEGGALNRAVAEALGWTITGQRPYYIRGPEGQEDTDNAVTLALAWDRAIHVRNTIPDYAHDLNAALTLPLTDITITGLMRPDGGWHVELAGMYYGSDDNLATAVCRAWLKYQRAQDDRKQEEQAHE